MELVVLNRMSCAFEGVLFAAVFVVVVVVVVVDELEPITIVMRLSDSY